MQSFAQDSQFVLHGLAHRQEQCRQSLLNTKVLGSRHGRCLAQGCLQIGQAPVVSLFRKGLGPKRINGTAFRMNTTGRKTRLETGRT